MLHNHRLLVLGSLSHINGALNFLLGCRSIDADAPRACGWIPDVRLRSFLDELQIAFVVLDSEVFRVRISLVPLFS